ncbi:MAG: transglutaminase-like domain-containing protein [Bacteroidia bacterium]
MLSEKEIEALIKLIDDPDEAIFNHVRSKLLEIGTNVIPHLESAWEQARIDANMQQRIEELIHDINFKSVEEKLKQWVQNGGNNLLEGAILIAKYQYPDLNTEKIYQKINQLKQDIWIELNDLLTPLEKTRVINHILFDVHNFSGNKKNFHSPQNSYINNVLETKKGNPLSLSIIYTHLAQELNIPIRGVNLPSHFVVAYMDDNQSMGLINPNEETYGILFYINPFSRGTVFNKHEIAQFLNQLKLEHLPEYYSACSNLDMIKRLITNLLFSYEKLGYKDKVEDMYKLVELLS